MTDLERALAAVLDGDQQRYVHLLNLYLAALAEIAALRNTLGVPEHTDGGETARGGRSEAER